MLYSRFDSGVGGKPMKQPMKSISIMEKMVKLRSACEYVCVCVCVCCMLCVVCVCVCVHVCVYVHACVCVGTCVRGGGGTCMQACVRVCVSEWKKLFVYLHC